MCLPFSPPRYIMTMDRIRTCKEFNPSVFLDEFLFYTNDLRRWPDSNRHTVLPITGSFQDYCLAQLGLHLQFKMRLLQSYLFNLYVHSINILPSWVNLFNPLRGGGRIRTYGPLLTTSGFQDRCNRPLCHTSKINIFTFHYPVQL